MKCPLCNAPTETTDTRTKDSLTTRRRMCFNEHIFKTEEKVITDPKRMADAGTKRKKPEEVKWNEWWPFTRATGDALRQLNRKQPKPLPDVPEALL